MKKNIKTYLAAVISFFIFSQFLSSETITFSADSMNGKNGSKSDTTTLRGNARVKTDSMEIKADVIILSGEEFRFITAEGAVEGTNTESELEFTCGKMQYDRKTKIAMLEDSVDMTDTANDVKAKAQIIEYNQDNNLAIMQINVSIKQKDNTCTSAYALYRKDRQILEMSGNPKIVQGEDSFRAQEITLNLNTQEITLDGRVSGTVSDTKKKKEEPVKEEKTGAAESEDKKAGDEAETAENAAANIEKTETEIKEEDIEKVEKN